MWAQALQATAKKYLHADGAWGESDCCQFISEYYRELTGVDHAAKFDYATGTGARKIMLEHGGLEGLLEHILGEPSEPKPGSVCTYDLPSGVGCGVYTGYCIWAIIPEDGLMRFPSELVRMAW